MTIIHEHTGKTRAISLNLPEYGMCRQFDAWLNCEFKV
jgi:hypothetical protein